MNNRTYVRIMLINGTNLPASESDIKPRRQTHETLSIVLIIKIDGVWFIIVNVIGHFDVF